MKDVNPYNYNLPVGPEMFFGRREDTEHMVRSLATVPGDSFALVGGRRMGKTSMLEQLLRRLADDADHGEQGLLPVPILLDLSGERISSAVAFFRIVVNAGRAALADRLGLWADEQDREEPPGPAFRQWLERCERTVMAERGCCLRLVLLLDECEQITQHPWTPELYAALRYLLVGRTTRSAFKVVMAGSQRFLTEVRQEGSPLRNALAYRRLRVLDESATCELIASPTKGVLRDNLARAVASQSGGHPFLTQYLMHHLWERGLETTSMETVHHVASQFPNERGDFQDWVDGLGDAPLRVYRVLAQSDTPLAEAHIRAVLRPWSPDLPQALEALCYHGLATPSADRMHYRITGEMFHAWFTVNIGSFAFDDAKSPIRPVSADGSLAAVRSITDDRMDDHGSQDAPAARYNLEAIRKLLLAAFDTEELRTLFYFAEMPELQAVTLRFAESDGLQAMASKAVQHCDSRDLLGEMLAEVERQRPRLYERFKMDLYIGT